MVAVNLGAPMRLVRMLSPTMVQQKRGTIINIGDVEALRPDADQAAYAASKHALHGWTSSIYHVKTHFTPVLHTTHEAAFPVGCGVSVPFLASASGTLCTLCGTKAQGVPFTLYRGVLPVVAFCPLDTLRSVGFW
jgi:hypothetical protein